MCEVRVIGAYRFFSFEADGRICVVPRLFRCPPSQVEGRTIRSAEKGPFIWLFSGGGCIICCAAICLRPAKLPM